MVNKFVQLCNVSCCVNVSSRGSFARISDVRATRYRERSTEGLGLRPVADEMLSWPMTDHVCNDKCVEGQSISSETAGRPVGRPPACKFAHRADIGRFTGWQVDDHRYTNSISDIRKYRKSKIFGRVPRPRSLGKHSGNQRPAHTGWTGIARPNSAAAPHDLVEPHMRYQLAHSRQNSCAAGIQPAMKR